MLQLRAMFAVQPEPDPHPCILESRIEGCLPKCLVTACALDRAWAHDASYALLALAAPRRRWVAEGELSKPGLLGCTCRTDDCYNMTAESHMEVWSQPLNQDSDNMGLQQSPMSRHLSAPSLSLPALFRMPRSLDSKLAVHSRPCSKVIVSGFIYTLVGDVLIMNPSMSCMPFLGGQGC